MSDASHEMSAGAASTGTPRLVLTAFEGPLDLLLHLIRTQEIDIYDIPIVEVCRQYDAYLGLMRELDLDVAGDYLVMAATLAHVKSRMLLPADPVGPGETPEDPRAGLVRQLLEYQRMKAAAEMLRDRDDLQADTFLRGRGGPDPLAEYQGEELLEVSLFDLLSAFKRLIETLEDATPLHVQRDEISVADKMTWILDRLDRDAAVPFRDLISPLRTRDERIAAFLALLELIRLRLIAASQRRPVGEILLRRSPDEETVGSPDEETAGADEPSEGDPE
ncbi:MAG: segregation and condensation protein A [Candidatus Polarisedimenticolia bacterium]